MFRHKNSLKHYLKLLKQQIDKLLLDTFKTTIQAIMLKY